MNETVDDAKSQRRAMPESQVLEPLPAFMSCAAATDRLKPS